MTKICPLVSALRTNNPKTNFFDSNASLTSYKTGFPVLDYYLGYMVNVYDLETNKVIETYPSLGISDGCFVCFIGKPSTGKTTAAVQIASNIVRPFENGIVVHYDLEQMQNYTRIQNLNNFTASDIDSGKYILLQGRKPIGDIKKAIVQLYKEKKDNPDKYRYNTGLKDEFGKDKYAFVPTVYLIDSIPQLSAGVDSDKALEDISSQTDRMRLTGEIGRFYSEVAPLCKETNIIVISINQIKDKPSMGFAPSAAELLYLKQDEALPGGKAPQFLANYLVKFVAVGSMKYKKEEDGFDGFGVRYEIIKNRTNQNGQYFNMIYDKNTGFQPIRSTVEFAKENGILGGNKNGYYLNGDKDNKFTLANMNADFHNNKILYKELFDGVKPFLQEHLGCINPEDVYMDDEMFNY